MPTTTTLAAAREAYFAASGFDTRTYTAPWVDVRFLGIPMRLPNTRQRKAAIERHDLHHSLTGYDASWAGEGRIAAWELGSGCGRNGAAWTLNLGAMAVGLAIAPRSTFAAFVRGRHCDNFYVGPFDRAVLGEDVEVVRARMGLATDARATPLDVAAFAATVVGSVAVTGAMLAAAPALIAGGLIGTRLAPSAA